MLQLLSMVSALNPALPEFRASTLAILVSEDSKRIDPFVETACEQIATRIISITVGTRAERVLSVPGGREFLIRCVSYLSRVFIPRPKGWLKLARQCSIHLEIAKAFLMCCRSQGVIAMVEPLGGIRAMHAIHQNCESPGIRREAGIAVMHVMKFQENQAEAEVKKAKADNRAVRKALN
jgi:hypothetical protein